MEPVTVLTCPKCHAPMHTYERGGVQVDQCAACRGIFLDRGELDRLLDIDSRPATGDYGGYRDYNRSGQDHRYRDDDHRHGRKKRNILSELFN